MEKEINMIHVETMFTKEKAIKIAEEMKKNDPDWTYTPFHDPKGTGFSFIAVYDENGEFISKL